MPRKDRRQAPVTLFGGNIPGDAPGDEVVRAARLGIVAAISLDRLGILKDLDERIARLGKIQAEDVSQAIDEWAERWGLTRDLLRLGIYVEFWGGSVGDAWLDRGGAAYVDDDRQNPPEASRDEPRPVGVLRSGAFSFFVEDCDLTSTPIDQWRRRVFHDFKEALLLHERGIRHEARAMGFVEAREPSPTHALHCEWFVRFHYMGQTYARIARTAKGPRLSSLEEIQRGAEVSAQAVGQAVRTIARAARIELRSKGRRGRPQLHKGNTAF